ncbi:hypothetical protein IAT40_003201 [Kwoniella sp. CBS 6097]
MTDQYAQTSHVSSPVPGGSSQQYQYQSVPCPGGTNPSLLGTVTQQISCSQESVPTPGNLTDHTYAQGLPIEDDDPEFHSGHAIYGGEGYTSVDPSLPGKPVDTHRDGDSGGHTMRSAERRGAKLDMTLYDPTDCSDYGASPQADGLSEQESIPLPIANRQDANYRFDGKDHPRSNGKQTLYDPDADLSLETSIRLYALRQGPTAQRASLRTTERFFLRRLKDFRAKVFQRPLHSRFAPEVERMTTSQMYFSQADAWLLSDNKSTIRLITNTENVEVTEDPGGVTILRARPRISADGTEITRILMTQADAEGRWTCVDATDSLATIPLDYEPVIKCEHGGPPHPTLTDQPIGEPIPEDECLHPAAQARARRVELEGECIQHKNVYNARNAAISQDHRRRNKDDPASGLPSSFSNSSKQTVNPLTMKFTLEAITRLKELAKGPQLEDKLQSATTGAAFRKRRKLFRDKLTEQLTQRTHNSTVAQMIERMTTSEIHFSDADRWLLSNKNTTISAITNKNLVEVIEDPGGVTILRAKAQTSATADLDTSMIPLDTTAGGETRPFLICRCDEFGLWTDLSAAASLSDMPSGYEPVTKCDHNYPPHPASTNDLLEHATPNEGCLHPAAQRMVRWKKDLKGECCPHSYTVMAKHSERKRKQAPGGRKPRAKANGSSGSGPIHPARVTKR